jgi:DNA-binding CsgD family transcriptional regulator
MDQVVDCKRNILSLMPQILPLSRCCIYEVEDDYVPTRTMNSDGVSWWKTAYHERRFSEIDPFRPSRFTDSRATVVAVPDVMPEEKWYECEYYRGFVQPNGIRHKVEIFFRDADERIFAGLRLNRTAEHKPFSSDEIGKLMSLQPFLNLSMLGAAERDAISRLKDRLQALSNREREVALLAIDGLSNKMICRRLGTTPATVATQLREVYRKLGVRGRGELGALTRSRVDTGSSAAIVFRRPVADGRMVG